MQSFPKLPRSILDRYQYISKRSWFCVIVSFVDVPAVSIDLKHTNSGCLQSCKKYLAGETATRCENLVKDAGNMAGSLNSL